MPKAADSQFKTASRLIDLLADLDAGKELTLKGVQDRFKIQKNAAREYIHFLGGVRCLESRVLGGQKRWGLAARDPNARAVVHVAALEFALDALEWLDGTQYYDQLRTLRKDVAATVPRSDHDHVQRLTRAVQRRPFGHPTDAKLFGRAAKALMQAIRGHHPCAMRYRRLDDAVKDYRVEPLVLVLQHDRVFVLARKQPSADLRIFDIEGIEEVTCVEAETFVPPPASEDPARLLKDSFGVYIDIEPPQRVRLLASGPALTTLRRRLLHPSQNVGDARPDGWAEVSFRVALAPPLEQFILGWVPFIRVLEPTSFRDRLMDAARAFIAGDPSGGPRDPSGG